MAEGSFETEDLEEETAVSDLINNLQGRLEEWFGQIEGTDVDSTKKFIEENNKKIQKQSEDFF